MRKLRVKKQVLLRLVREEISRAHKKARATALGEASVYGNGTRRRPPRDSSGELMSHSMLVQNCCRALRDIIADLQLSYDDLVPRTDTWSVVWNALESQGFTHREINDAMFNEPTAQGEQIWVDESDDALEQSPPDI